MKVIGKTEEGFIIQAGANEVFHLIGHYSKYSEGCPKIEVGNEIHVDKMYHQLRDLSLHRKTIMEMQAKLRVAVDLLDEVDPMSLPPPPAPPF
jgi:hypothetical protein